MKTRSLWKQPISVFVVDDSSKLYRVHWTAISPLYCRDNLGTVEANPWQINLSMSRASQVSHIQLIGERNPDNGLTTNPRDIFNHSPQAYKQAATFRGSHDHQTIAKSVRSCNSPLFGFVISGVISEFLLNSSPQPRTGRAESSPSITKKPPGHWSAGQN